MTMFTVSRTPTLVSANSPAAQRHIARQPEGTPRNRASCLPIFGVMSSSRAVVAAPVDDMHNV